MYHGAQASAKLKPLRGVATQSRYPTQCHTNPDDTRKSPGCRNFVFDSGMSISGEHHEQTPNIEDWSCSCH